MSCMRARIRCENIWKGEYSYSSFFFIYLYFIKNFLRISPSPTQNPIRKIIITAVIPFSKRFPLRILIYILDIIKGL